MKQFSLALCFVIGGVVPALAHHALTAYDRTTYKTIEGTLKSFDWRNPHVRVLLNVPGANSRMVEWDFEGGSINRLSNGGFKRDTFETGDKVTVSYNPFRNGSNGGFFLAITGQDGKTYGAERLRGYPSGAQLR